MTECSFCYEKALKYSIDDIEPVEVYAYCSKHASDLDYWLVENLPRENEISESEYLLYLAMDTL
jgi:hypothetical protein